ncbi:cytochrome C biogenesis protein [Komagataeibacter rhaeticus]|uniref:protein-disulfide reductase DsbD family protein n=1 Tax=Komagataeibacter rhaeticus TaxID=215221 RepID=UPI0004D3B046|nr:protein-disulfide reductase DsbD domain-containing protein [Komagataeibacter rhaeticus]KDU97092.1 cytochrome C biogenesis protein [Komagataeibacter rhaeticus AF1]MBL7240424.1 thioredoxin family protein [Komagataeibacter rhaeticus]PYD53884.1 cytochrome C biogenesis protein [Komagataeibacter rhaeticus]
MVVPFRWLVSILCMVLLAAPAARAAQSAAVSSERARVTLVTDDDAYMPGRALHVGLQMHLAPGWHTYWLNPGDAGEATTLTVTARGGADGQASAIEWPVPRVLHDGPLTSYAYTGDVLLPVTLVPVAGQGDGPVTLSAVADWLVCADVCVPEHGTFTLVLPRGGPQPSAQVADFARAGAQRPVASPFAARLSPAGILQLAGRGLSPDAVTAAWFMPDVSGAIDQDVTQPLVVGDGTVQLTLRPGPEFHGGAGLSGIVVLRDGTGRERGLAVRPVVGTVQPLAPPVATVHAAHIGVLVLMAFVGGMILNLMPCVFPVLAMKILSLERMARGERRAALGGAAAYAAGVVGSFVVLGGAIAALRVAGQQAGWGFQFQSVGFVIVICLLLFAVALNLLGVFAIGLRLMGVGTVLPAHAGDFLTGVLAVVLASPCTAPFMGAAVAGALAASPLAGLLVFVALGLGLAAPYLLLAAMPGLLGWLPRPGRWMETVRNLLALPVLATCVWLGWVAWLEGGQDALYLLGAGLVLVALGCWCLRRATAMDLRGAMEGRAGLYRAVAILSLLVAFVGGAVVPPASVHDHGAERVVDGSSAFSPTRLAELRGQGRPVFVDMTAAWCISCLVNERVALSTHAVQAAFARQGIVYMKGDWTQRNADITAFLHAHGRDGVPFYVYYPARGAEVVLPEILSPGLVLRVIGAGGN